MFVVSTMVYWLTAEPTGSFWDCGEFIGCAYKLQVPHSPGAPLFIILAHLVTLLAPDPSSVALSVNYFSGVMSALTNLFLFWSITALGRKILEKKEHELNTAETIALMGAGLVGAMANCFADSFWFSAVEGEVYASSSFFTAIVFWAILKWDQVADQPYSDRWILFIGYMLGLAVGVHLLGLLAIPAIVMVYYFRKYTPSRWGIIKAFVIGCLILGFIQYGIIPQIPNLSAKFDILFVNSFGLPFNTGAAFFFVLLVGLIAYGLYYSVKKRNYVLNTAILTAIFIIIGYSSYVMVLIRSNANPSINMGAPNNPISLLSYLNREQYGDHPLVYGQSFAAQPIDIDRESGEMRYYQDRSSGRYEELGRKPEIIYDASDKMLFPRIWDNDDPSHIRFYRSWLDLKEGEKPTFGDNIKFFLQYQVGFMYWRYFLWNFSGRQNDIQGDGDIKNGNWITGFSFIDNAMLGDQSNLPYPLDQNKGRNKFYLIPFILGILGALYHFKRSKYDAFVVLLFFFFTGLAIVIYLNQPPQQPRERDYAYAGSVYAFAIWIGISVLWLFELLQKRTSATVAAGIATLVAGIAPALMGAGGWDDHDRSGRYVARDMGRNYLESCAPNAILFTQGDNDTYPLWYAQEVEGIRPDVRIVNLSLLGVDWYIDNLRRKTNESDAVIISVDSASYRGSTRDYLRYYENRAIPQNDYYSISNVLDYMFSEDPRKQVEYAGSRMNYVPARNLYIPVNKSEVIALGVVQPEDTAKIVDRVQWRLNKNTLLKNDIMTLEILRSNLWKRPIYFAISVAPDSYLGLNNYFQQEGLTYRLVPYVARKGEDGLAGGVQANLMYHNMMNKFAWGGIDKEELYLDENVMRMVTNLRSNFARLSTDLIAQGRNESALKALDKCMEALPEKNVPVAINSIAIGKNYYEAGAPEKGSQVLNRCYEVFSDQLRYYTALPADKRKYFNEEISNGLYVLNSISSISRSEEDTTLSNKAEEAFKKYLAFYEPPAENRQ